MYGLDSEKKNCFWENTNYLFSQSTPYKEKFEDTKRVIKSRNSIEEGQTIQWPNEKGQKENNYLQNTTQKN
jgi:hypothetical protein